MEICGFEGCRKPILRRELVWVPKAVPRTASFPAHVDEVPMHVQCRDYVTSGEYAAKCDEMERMRHLSWEERSRT